MSLSCKRRVCLNIFLICMLLLLGFAGMRALTALRSRAQERPAAAWIPRVRAMDPEAGLHHRRIQAYGRLQPGQRFLARSEIHGHIDPTSPTWNRGQRVEAGSLLVIVAAPGLQRSLATALAEISRIENELQRLEAQEAADQGLLKIEQELAALAQTQLEREEEAFAAGSRSQRSLDGQRQQSLSAQAAVLLRQRGLDSLPFQRQALRAQLEAAEASRQEAENLLQRSRVLAPFTGRIQQDSLSAGESVSPGQLLMEVSAEQDREVHVQVSRSFLEDAFPAWSLDQIAASAAPISFHPIGSSRSFRGQIQGIAGIVDSRVQQPLLILRLDDQEGMNYEIDGSVGLVEIEGLAIEGLRLPRSVRDDDALWAVDAEQQIQRLVLRWNSLDADHIVIDQDAAKLAGYRVLLRPQPEFVDGMRVQIIDQEAAP